MSAYLREQRRELYSKSGELQGEEDENGVNWEREKERETREQLDGRSEVKMGGEG